MALGFCVCVCQRNGVEKQRDTAGRVWMSDYWLREECSASRV